MPPVKIIAWGLSGSVVVLAVFAWSQALNWRLDNLSNYQLFPVFGLAAYSLIWSLYIINYGLRKTDRQAKELGRYYKTTSLTALFFILLHPGLLIWQLWRDGLGLPPGSYWNNYVASAAHWAVVLSSISFAVFLLYEFRHKYKNENWWRYVEYAGDLAMVAVYFHALRLGSQIQASWFRYVWFCYGITLAWVLFDNYRQKLIKK